MDSKIFLTALLMLTFFVAPVFANGGGVATPSNPQWVNPIQLTEPCVEEYINITWTGEFDNMDEIRIEHNFTGTPVNDTVWTGSTSPKTVSEPYTFCVNQTGNTYYWKSYGSESNGANDFDASSIYTFDVVDYTLSYVCQEDANETSYTGWTNPANAIDGNYSTYAQYDGSGVDLYYMNYTVPDDVDALASLWTIKNNVAFNNRSLTGCAVTDNKLMIRVNYQEDEGRRLMHDCYTGSGWLDIGYQYHGSVAQLYEEAICWATKDYFADASYPTYSNPTSNATFVGEAVMFSVDWTSYALEPNGQYMFSSNMSGSWLNDTWYNFSSTPETLEFVGTLTSEEGVYAWCVYAKDNVGNENNTMCENPIIQNVYEIENCNTSVTFQDLPDAYSVDCTSFGCAGWENVIVKANWFIGGRASDDDNTATIDCSYDDWMGVKLDYLVEYEKPLLATGGNLSVWIYLDTSGQCSGLLNLTQYNLTIPQDCWDYNTTTVYAKVGVQQYDGSGWEATDVYCLNDTSSWVNILDLDGEFDSYGMPLAETGMYWNDLSCGFSPAPEDLTPFEAILGAIGEGMGNFLSALPMVIGNLLFMMAMVVFITSIVFAIAQVFHVFKK